MHLVRRRLVHAALGVDAGVDAGDVATGTDENAAIRVGLHPLRHRVKDLNPREIQGAVVIVVWWLEIVFGQIPADRRGTVEDCKTIPKWWCNGPRIGLHRAIADAGRGYQGNVVDGLERVQGGWGCRSARMAKRMT